MTTSPRMRAWVTWGLFVAACAVALAATYGLGQQALSAAAQRNHAQTMMLHSERLRSALWRLDSLLAPLVAAEGWWLQQGGAPAVTDSAIKWSPQRVTLAAAKVQQVAAGPFGDPQVQQDDIPAEVRAALREREVAAAGAQVPAMQLPQMPFPDPFAGGTTVPVQVAAPVQQQAGKGAMLNPDFASRMTQNVAAQQSFLNAPFVADVHPVEVFWAGPSLVLALRPASGRGEAQRAAVVDGATLRAALAQHVEDLLPGAELVPAEDGAAEDTARLATLPLRLEAPVPEPDMAPVLAVKRQAHIALLSVAGMFLAAGLLIHRSRDLAERRRRFVSAVTHELRTPLTSLQLYTDLLRREGTPEGTRREYANTLAREAARLRHLVDNVLDYARLERRTAHLEPCDARELLERFVPRLSELAAAAAPARTLCVAGLDAAAGAVLRADAVAVERILMNLVDNACRHGTPFADAEIHLTVRRDGGRLVLTVEDSGPGPEAGAARKAFAVGAEEAAQRGRPGVGLGLALSRQLARRLGGNLELALRVPGPGACARLTLPCSAG